jgi:multimeric flavodoxin WrbA
MPPDQHRFRKCHAPQGPWRCVHIVGLKRAMTEFRILPIQTKPELLKILDLSLLMSQYGRVIHPCKACVSTAQPLGHWPCSCYPNFAMGQTSDWTNEIYPMWAAAHSVMIVTPINWYQAPKGLKAIIDRLVCADGGNTDPTTTGGKDPAKAKELN